MTDYNYLINTTIGFLTIKTITVNRYDGYATCICKCGTEKNIPIRGLLRARTTKSCGCLTRKHGLHGHPLYSIWLGMKKRCFNPNYPDFHNYGGRGITVCTRWLDVKNFIADMESGYSEELSLDRIDVNGNYEPSNCRWATSKEQSKNKQNSIYVFFNGKKVHASDFAERTGWALTRIRPNPRTIVVSSAP
jgi:hypothetical protein